MRGLYIVTPNWDDTSRMVLATEQAIKGGACIVQYRHKSASLELRKEQASALQKVCKRYQVPFIINDYVELALELDTDGIHVGESDMPVKQVKQLAGPNKIIGASCYDDIQMARQAMADGATYVAFGGFFPSQVKETKVNTPKTIISDWKKERPDVPLCIIGGMTVENAPELVRLGADLVAVVSGVYFAQDVEQAAKSYLPMFK